MRNHDWIIEVLNEIEEYAAKNNLPAASRQANQAKLIALNEIARAGQVGEYDHVMEEVLSFIARAG